jgi:nucleoporin SEH1
MSVQPFDSLHEDLIHDVAYDFYGKRFVTCSSDQKLKVWEFNQETNTWEQVDSWKVIINLYPVLKLIKLYY